MMDHEIRKSGLAGNFCAIILELDSVVDATLVKDKCVNFCQRFPLAGARLVQTGRHFVWNSTQDSSVPFYQHHRDPPRKEDNKQQVNTQVTTDDPRTCPILTEILNQSSPATETAPIELHLITDKTTSKLILRWFHPLCDAKGAELILHHLFNDDGVNNEKAEDEQAQAIISMIMNKWSLWQKLKLILKSKKNIKQLDRFSSVLPPPSTAKADQVNIRVVRFNEQQSAQILNQARQHVGLAGITLYFIGCMMRALEGAGTMQGGDAYCVPYAMNLRKRKSLFPVFGNQVSFLFAQAQTELLASRSTLFSHLREQNKHAIKNSLDRAMLPLMQAGSWLSLEKYAQLVRYSPSGQERSTFWFSYTGSMDPQTHHIGGSAITGMYQFCQLTSPPSLGLLVNNFDNKITLSYNYINSQFDDAWLTKLIDNMTTELLECE